MKKRLLSALLALALVFVLLPTTALADTTPVTDENVKINGTPVTVGNGISLGEGNGTYSYDKSTRTLTLNNATITATGSNIGIDFCDTTNYVTYSVILTGENTVTSNNIAIETTPNTNLTFTGGGNLKAITNGYYQAIRVYGTLTIDNSTLIAESSAYTATTVIWTLAMTGNNAKLEISNKSAANIVAGTAGPASNIDWSNYQFTTGSYSGDALTESDPEVCSWGTLKEYLGFPTKKYSQYICIAKRTIPAIQRTPDVLIAGENAVVSVETSIPSANGSGTYFYDQASKTLTLNNVNITKGINAIQFMAKGAYTIKLEGENKISNVSNGISLSDDQYITSLNVTITGTGSLDISAKGLAINMKKGDLKFENTGAIKLATSSIGLNNNALSVKGNITITDMSKYSVTGTQQTGGKPLGSEVSLTEASQLKGGTTGYRIITITPAALEKSNVYVAGTNLYKNTAYTIQNGKPVMGGTYPSNYNIYFDATDYVLHVKDATNIDARGTTGIYGTSNIVFEGKNSITASTYGIYSYFKSSDLKISGTGSLEVKTIAGDPAIATAYDTSRSIIISGNDFTVTADTSGTTSYAIKSDKDLTITGGAAVTAKSNATRAIDIKGNLTVTNGSLKATSTSNNVPTVQVGGNASFTGSTVTITNNSTTQGKQYEDSNAASSALHVNGAVTISGGTVTAEAKAGGNAIRAVGNITVSNDATVTAKNNSQYFNAITAGRATGGEVNTLYNLIVSGENTRITATNAHDNKLAYGGAINAYIKNANEGHYLKVGTDTKAIAPNVKTTVKNNSLTITRGNAYSAPQVAANYKIAGQTMHVGQYYKTDANGNITDGTAQDYNIYCDSENDFTLNNATISSTGTDVAINTNIRYETNVQHHIKLIGTNRINNTFKHAISAGSNSSTIIIEGVGNASDASLTINGNFLPIYSDGKVIINAEVVIVNTTDDNSFKGLISTSDGKGAFDLGSGYKCYASTSTTGTPLEEFNSANYSTYKYLRVTTQTLETGGGSTHQHTSETGWETDGTNHWKTCSTCSQRYNEGACTISGYNNDNGASGYHKVLCSVGHVMKTESHDYEYKITQDGTMHYKECKTCHYTTPPVSHNFGSSGTESCECGAIPSHTHNLSGQKGNDETNHWDICSECSQHVNEAPHTYGDWITDAPATDTTDGSKHRICSVCQYQENATIPKTGTGEIVPPTPDNPGTIVIIRPAEEEKPAQQPNPSTGANDLVGLAVAAAVAAALGSAALLRKHD